MSLVPAEETPAAWPPQRAVAIEISTPKECRRLLSRAKVGASLEAGTASVGAVARGDAHEVDRSLRFLTVAQIVLWMVLTVCFILLTVSVMNLTRSVQDNLNTITSHLQPKDIDNAIASGLQSVQNVQLTTGSMANAGELVEAGAVETVAAINQTNALIIYANSLMANILHNPSVKLSLSGGE